MTAAQFESRREVLIQYLRMKTEVADWHGCADAACDLRDLEAEWRGMSVIRSHGWAPGRIEPGDTFSGPGFKSSPFKPLDLSMYEPQSIPQPASKT